MSKKGGSRHYVRMRAAKRLGVANRKKVKWLLAPSPGPHPKAESVSAGVLLRDVMGRARNMHEVKKILNAGGLAVDGKRVTEPKYPLGLMDIVSEPLEGRTYRMSLDGPNLIPKDVDGERAKCKYLKVTGKRTIRGGRIQLSFHDGRTYLGDKNVRTGDTCVFSVPGFKLLAHLKFGQGARCLVTKGKHIGEVATLAKIIERPGSQDTEVLMQGDGSEFITLAKYLFVVDEKF